MGKLKRHIARFFCGLGIHRWFYYTFSDGIGCTMYAKSCNKCLKAKLISKDEYQTNYFELPNED